MSCIYFLTVNYYSSSLINRLIKSIRNSQVFDYRFIIVNNSPQDWELRKLDNARLHIIESGSNLGFSKACNLGLNYIYQQDSQGIVWLINPDVYNISRNLDHISKFFGKYPHISILGTTVYNPTGEISFAGGVYTPRVGYISTLDSWTDDSGEDYVASDWISGCSLLINLSNFSRCPQFDPNYFLYYEDFDFCRRYAKQGHQIAITKLFEVVHETSSITNRNIFNKFKYITHSYLLYMEKYSCLRVFLLTLLRISIATLVLLPIKPHKGLGKLFGLGKYFKSKFIFLYQFLKVTVDVMEAKKSGVRSQNK